MSHAWFDESYKKPFIVTGNGEYRRCCVCELEFSIPDARIHAEVTCGISKKRLKVQSLSPTSQYPC
jgi:hypothetical protein